MELNFSWGWYFLAMLAMIVLCIGLSQFRSGRGNKDEHGEH